MNNLNLIKGESFRKPVDPTTKLCKGLNHLQELKMLILNYGMTISQISLNWLINAQGDTV